MPDPTLSRRTFLNRAGVALGTCALPWLFEGEAVAEGSSIRPLPDLAPRARNVILLHMVGGPSQLDLFDPKPTLVARNGEPCPAELIEGERFAFIQGHPTLLGSPYEFKKHGQSGIELSELLPHMSGIVDDMCMIRSVHGEQFNHGPAQLLLNTGFPRFGRPSIGSWVSYGLGTVNQDLPSYVVLVPGNAPGAGNALWSNGFLPGVHQGIEFRASGEPVFYLSNPAGVDTAVRRRTLDTLNNLNRERLKLVGDPEIATRIEQYELAFRMQQAVPELTDITREPDAVREAYGATPGDGSFASSCLLARRLVERGVRFVELFHSDWDHHTQIYQNLPKRCMEIDQPVTALVQDLKQRGLLDETLIVFSGEFGRTPLAQVNDGFGNILKPGRDHHPGAFTMWMAGGGVKAGTSYGKTDDFGYRIVEDPVHVHDIQATILRLLGIRHKQLTYPHLGREFRLTDVEGKVIHSILS